MTMMVPARAAFAALFIFTVSAEARAEDASPWQKDSHSQLRLLAGSRSGTVLLGGIALQLQPGWHTYWGNPGDSGVPPRFDFSKSDNVEAVTVLWPAPQQFDDGAGGVSLGYHDQLVLPLRIVAKSVDKPVTLRGTIDYAVCEKICIPVQANAELTFSSVASTEDSVLFAALDTVPKPANVGDPNPLTIRDVKREGKAQVLVDVVTPETLPPYLFAADILIIPPSRAPLDRFGDCVLPLKTFAYLAAGRAILAPRSPDTAELLRDGETALLVPPDDSEAAAEG